MWTKAALAVDVPPGTTTRFSAAKHEYLLARTQDGRFFAGDLSCTHKYAELDSTSALVGTLLTCISHGATFDLAKKGVLISPTTTGDVCPALRTFATRVEGDAVMVEIPDHDKPPEVPY